MNLYKRQNFKNALQGVAEGKETIERNFRFGALSLGEIPKDGTRFLTLRLACFKYGSIQQWKDFLYEPEIVWVRADRMVLSGFERIESGDFYIEYSQSWMVIIHDVQIDKFEINVSPASLAQASGIAD